MAYDAMNERELAHALMAVLRYRCAQKVVRGSSPHPLGGGITASSVLLDAATTRVAVVAEAIGPEARAESVAGAVTRARELVVHFSRTLAPDESRPDVWICVPTHAHARVVADHPGLTVRWVPYDP